MTFGMIIFLEVPKRMPCLHGNYPLIRLSATYPLRGYPPHTCESFGFHR